MNAHGQAGFAQLLVIAALAVLAAVLTVALSTARLGSQQISALDAQVFADTRLTSGLALLQEALRDPTNNLELRALAAPVMVDLADAEVELAIVGEGGKLDVLRADPALIERFAKNAGLARDETTALLDELGKMRKRGDDAGAMEAVRLAFAETVGPVGVDDNFTRFGSDRIDPTFATDAVLQAIPDLGPSQIAQMVASPSSQRTQYATLSTYFASGSRRFMLIARMSEKPGHRFEKRLPIELTTSGGFVELDGAR